MWQHVARKGLRENKKHKSVGSLDVQGHRKRERDDDNVPNVKKPRLMQFSMIMSWFFALFVLFNNWTNVHFSLT